jgi:hypothetical protein
VTELEFYESLGIEPLVRGGAILIAKEQSLKVGEALISSNIQILGFDAFKLYSNNKIQPFMQFSKDYSASTHKRFSKPPDLLNDLRAVSSEITHIEFVIEFY